MAMQLRCGLALTIVMCASLAQQRADAATIEQKMEAVALDADGVQMLRPFAAKVSGSQLRLGGQDPNVSSSFAFDYKVKATASAASESVPIRYWNLPSVPLTYSSGASGYTARLHLYASGGVQKFNWKTQQGFLSSVADVKNQEFTVYVRVHELLTPKIAQVTLKIRGGGHHEKDPDAGSCTMMTFAPTSSAGVTRFGKELSHPLYDYVTLKPLLDDVALKDNKWVGLKLLSYVDKNDPARVINQLHVDTEPFSDTGKPANRWRLLSEYVDVEGKRTGRYSKLVDWGGWQTTLRMDGYRSIDFAFPSVREITPP